LAEQEEELERDARENDKGSTLEKLRKGKVEAQIGMGKAQIKTKRTTGKS